MTPSKLVRERYHCPYVWSSWRRRGNGHKEAQKAQNRKFLFVAFVPFCGYFVLLGNDAFADGVQNQFRVTVEIQFALKVSAMCFDGIETQVEQAGDIFVRSALDQQLQDLFLAWSEQIITVFGSADVDLPNVIFSQDLADFGAEERLTLAYDFDGLDQITFRYNLGLASIVELTQAQLNVTQAEIENLSAKYDYQTQNAALQYSSGLLR